jgi:glycosyltransferase involved in cell wall biosynthesis
MDRKGINPLSELLTLIRLIRLIRSECPDILHNFTIKPIIYGTIASWFCISRPKVINNFIGMGFVFISKNPLYVFIRSIICFLLSIDSKFGKTKTIVQNSDDKKLLEEYGISNIFTQCSVGVNMNEFALLPEPKGDKIIFALVSRMLIDKGIYEFVKAAQILHKKGLNAEFWLVGFPDEGNKSSLTMEEIHSFEATECVKYLGFQNVENIWRKAHVAVLPSYREGMSRSLLEAGAYGRAIITTDAPGGRDLVTHNVNGLLVQLKSVEGLEDAMEFLVLNPEIRKNFAHNIRQEIASKYDSDFITNKMVHFYD